MRMLELAAVAVALTLSGEAFAQTAPPPSVQAPQPPSPEMRGPDDRVTDFLRMRDEVAGRRAGPTKSKNPVPASPEDIIQGSEVRDSKGVPLGTIESVGKEFAVVAGEAGKVEVEFDSFAKNYKGLLINLPKAKFDSIVSGNKPAR
ncbi:hypothetical protein [Sphingomonas sp. M1-B02]|uniref:hypothetical protein n=1 Tax=Sphingomonas sp. M1-B02 TaxID=3114300 RepID=UPI00223EFB8F|nr:hypothetical protein [Sphingomonas sp. S6-11]UZK65557.1 hypothetical protein OKW87_13715 [Sphingomonas sp. S6-11]